jgi:hypothetical protein
MKGQVKMKGRRFFLSYKATSNNWFRSENEALRMDGKASEESSIGRNPSNFRNAASRRCRPFVAEIKVFRGGNMPFLRILMAPAGAHE